jgi:hypothetical protein
VYSPIKTSFLVSFLIAVSTIIFFAAGTNPAKADGPPSTTPTAPATTDSCFRQDHECYDIYPQLPEEVIGRAVDCPDGQTGYVVDAEGRVECPPSRTETIGYSIFGISMVLVGVLITYLLYRLTRK